MKIIHKAGRTYNDVKPQNVMISYKNKEIFNSQELDVTIIDFGFVSKFREEIDNQYQHIKRNEMVDLFQGNI